jgi:bifunctional enzyme CysN/CysC
MATGASTCDLAVILIDARHGVQVQTRRHSFITSLLGIRHLVVAINKMDLVGYSEATFERIKADYLSFAKGLTKADFHFIPMSALDGDNVVNPSAHMPWYQGQTLMSLFETVEIAKDRNLKDLRFPVQYVNRPNLNFRGFCGTVASGIVRKGDEIVVLPSQKKSRVKSIVTYDEELESAYTDMAVTLTLEDEIDISRGDMIVHSDNYPVVTERFRATIVWMAEQPMLPGKMYDFKLGTKTVMGTVKTLKHQIDVNTLEKRPAPTLELNSIGVCEVEVDQLVCIDNYSANRSTGALIVIDRLSNATIGAGMISVDASHSAAHTDATSSTVHVTREERAARYGQSPATVMFIGISGAGKSTMAHGLERRLFDMGRVSTVLDGKNMRLGISKDLPHDQQGRAENLRRSAHVARLLNDSGLICCAAFVAPNKDSREHALSVIGRDNCFMIYLNPSLDVCKQRDPSGLYAAAELSPSADIPGVSFPYEAPEAPDLVLDTGALSIEECISQVIKLLKDKKVI